ncbi:U1 snrp Snp1p and RRM domain-containing protein [Cryptosporidium canis]|uniref:U1 snrp Snp1p and RRM domain-containing protein n=1 Tax=Cryptosporidium canis TaxID=195482 RepID=A0ABQ8P1E5_9CRYT|nr:U1 snrp Snp1p and RRM domain-containing protein [Cryptosporidium canis]KAJ1604421.1 U1 snrp Snp1p and RRM domain-containing protein [Cryptosporidium canis]
MSAVGMPSDLLKFFQSRPPLPYIPYPKKRQHRAYQGLGDFLSENPDIFDKTNPPPPEPYIDKKMRKEQQKLDRIIRYKCELQNRVQLFDPKEENPEGKTQDPYNTLFIARLNYDTTEKTLRKELEEFGNLVSLHLVTDLEGESRGYAFAEFENEESLKQAYRSLNKKVIDGWRILVDVERGRTVENWLPKRLGGGMGKIRGQEKYTPKRYSDNDYKSHASGHMPHKHREQGNFKGYSHVDYNSSRNYGGFGNKKFKYF